MTAVLALATGTPLALAAALLAAAGTWLATHPETR